MDISTNYHMHRYKFIRFKPYPKGMTGEDFAHCGDVDEHSDVVVAWLFYQLKVHYIFAFSDICTLRKDCETIIKSLTPLSKLNYIKGFILKFKKVTIKKGS